jgi:histone arginine demethylase JMJD6
LGPEGSGAPLHSHTAAFNGLVYGEKQWFLYPPGHAQAVYSAKHPRAWLEEDLPRLDADARPFGCRQRPGEVLFVPAGWVHSAINNGESVGFAVELSTAG